MESHSEETMVKLVVLYGHPTDPASFDDYFTAKGFF